MDHSADLEESIQEQIARMRGGDEAGLAAVFSLYRERLKRIVHFRLDHRLTSRVSDSDVLQETYIAAAKRLEHFGKRDDLPAFVWLRLILGQQLIDCHRQHLNAEMRDVRREVALPQAAGGEQSAHTSQAIAAHLAAKLTAASDVVARAERLESLERILNQLEPLDREVIALRHFEELSNVETAQVLSIETSAASKRYVRAMARLAELMASQQHT